MAQHRSKSFTAGSVTPAIARLVSFLGCLLTVQTTPAAAQVNTAVPPSRGSLPAAPPWSGVSGNPPRPLTRALVTPPPALHPAIHPLRSTEQPLRPLFPRAGEELRKKAAREAAMRRHPAGKARADAGTPPAHEGAKLPPAPVSSTSVEKTGLPRIPDCTKTQVVRPGDSLWAIAGSHRTPADGSTQELTRRIYEMNRRTIGPDPDLILPGQRLVLPEDCER